MQRMSAQAVAALHTAARRPVRAAWSNDGGRTWTDARIGSGRVTPDRTAECRYTASVELLDVPTGSGGINTEATRIKLWQGIAGPRMDPEWVPAGEYVVDRARRAWLGLQCDLLGLEDAIRSASFPVPRTIGPDTAEALLPVLVGEALPGVPVSWRPGVDAGTSVPQFVGDEDRWAVLSSGTDASGTRTGIAAALGAECYVDARGVFTMAPVPTLADRVVWRIPRGVAVVGEPTEEQSAEGLVNLWAVSGDGGDGSPAVGPVFVWDDDPNSLTYAGPDPVEDPLAPQRLGLPVRLRVERYSSPLITSEGQAHEVGRARLADSLGVQSSLTFTSVCHPGLEPGDLVEVEVRPGEWQRHIIDSCPYELGGVSMTCKTRTTARRTT
ncbi:phage tail protein [Streptomyces chumphonensis]|uniref:phage tail protein n=1 Tax=Streptomyces chumphonensis TaxID=1214925 RepID=UPI003D72A2A7